MDGLHPYFDGGAIRWETRLDDALGRARAERKKVFLLAGRPSCEGTRHLVEKNLAKRELNDFLDEYFVALAVDVEAAEPAVAALLGSLPRQAPTPVCAYLAADGRVLHSTAGGRPPAVLLSDMNEAHAKK